MALVFEDMMSLEDRNVQEIKPLPAKFNKPLA